MAPSSSIHAGGLITVTDDKPELGFGTLIGLAVDRVPVSVWERLITKPCYIRPVDSLSPHWNEGQWKQRTRTARVKRMYRSDGKPRANRVQYTAIHEVAGHGSDSDVLTRAKRQGIMALMGPKPAGWEDVGNAKPGTMAEYWALPYESYANRMVEAVTNGAVRSPFDDDYTRWVPDAQLAEMLSIAMLPVVTPDPDPAPEPMPEPPPSAELLECRAKVERYEADALEAVHTLWNPAWGEPPA